MPVYDYECSCCSLQFEVKRGFNDDSRVICNGCGSEARRVFSPVPIIFKGSGFYCTDHGRSGSGSWGEPQENDSVSEGKVEEKKEEPQDEKKDENKGSTEKVGSKSDSVDLSSS